MGNCRIPGKTKGTDKRHMNIQEAEQEVVRTVRAYTSKNEMGEYQIPVEKQRPLLLIGPPGIGKTAIMEQAARECGVNLISYTITHHTRQSAIGLPFLVKKEYGGKETTVTEYSMSEIIASVYDQIQKSGVQEGILFLDEINCVSETLAPTMLQFLQYKTFGTHHLPDGFVIVTAGNPPQYNKSVREFDIVTLDRIRRIDIQEDLTAWKKYAYEAGVHGAIMAYLEIRKDHFYSIRTDVENRYFVTARGWEDLSRVMKVYEEMDLPVTENLIGEYLQDPEIARDFADYYELYSKYQKVYRIPEILDGTIREETLAVKNAPFDEKLSLMGLLIDALREDFRNYAEQKDVQEKVLGTLQTLTARIKSGAKAAEALRDLEASEEEELKKQEEAGMLGRKEAHDRRLSLAALRELEKELVQKGTGEGKEDFSLCRNWFEGREKKRQEEIRVAGDHLTHAFDFMAKCFGEGQEMVIFLSELSADQRSVAFVNDCGNEAYFKYNKLLLLDERRSQLTQDIMQLMP